MWPKGIARWFHAVGLARTVQTRLHPAGRGTSCSPPTTPRLCRPCGHPCPSLAMAISARRGRSGSGTRAEALPHAFTALEGMAYSSAWVPGRRRRLAARSLPQPLEVAAPDGARCDGGFHLAAVLLRARQFAHPAAHGHHVFCCASHGADGPFFAAPAPRSIRLGLVEVEGVSRSAPSTASSDRTCSASAWQLRSVGRA